MFHESSWLNDLMCLVADLLQLCTILINWYILNVTDVYHEMAVACLNAKNHVIFRLGIQHKLEVKTEHVKF
jgi:hypothetical protein